jgi:hypothetical protein
MSRRNGGIIGPANTPVGGLFTGVASGVWRMNDVLTFVSNNQWPSGPQSIENSCRFDDGSSDNLSRTFSTPTSGTTWTISFWVKKTTNGSALNLCSRLVDGSNEDRIRFTSGDALEWSVYKSGSYAGRLVTNRLFRDNSAFYNIICVWDTTNGTAGDRMRIYVNGVEETSFSTDTNPSSSTTSLFNASGSNHRIGSVTSGEYFDGYMAEVVMIDGQALDQTPFGETDSTTGIWKPKKIGSFTSAGTNSFYLDFKDSSNLGNDASGLNNDFTVNNLTSIDQSTDTCVVNYCTLNILAKPGTGNMPPIAEGGLHYNKTNTGSGNNAQINGTIGVSSGKYYFEIKPADSSAQVVGISVVQPLLDTHGGGISSSSLGVGVVYYNNGNKYVNGTQTSYGDTWTTNDIIGCAFDLDNNFVYFSKNGTFQDSGDPTSGSTGTGGIACTANLIYTPTIQNNNYNVATSTFFNFGNPPYSISSGNSDANGFGNFEYAVPSGYYALNTTNLNTYG